MASRGKMADDHGEAHRALFEECLAKLTVGGERSGFLTKEKSVTEPGPVTVSVTL